MKILVTGIAGRLGRIVANCLLERGHDVVGIDRRPYPEHPAAIRVFSEDLLKRQGEDVFRAEHPDGVVHLASVTSQAPNIHERHRVNLGGTKAVFDYCKRYGIARVAFVGRHTYYGALPDLPLYHTEDDPPLGVESYPELADLVAADLYAVSALWRLPQMATAVLRICYTLGPSGQGTLADYVRGRRVPTVLGYDPLFQVMDENDAARAVALALEHGLRGVFNVAGPEPLPLSALIRRVQRQRIPLLKGLFPLLGGRAGLPKLAAGAIQHLKYPVVIDCGEFIRHTAFAPEYSLDQTLASFPPASPEDS